MLSQMCSNGNNPEEFVTANPLLAATIHCRMLAPTSPAVGSVRSGPCSLVVESGPDFLLSSCGPEHYTREEFTTATAKALPSDMSGPGKSLCMGVFCMGV